MAMILSSAARLKPEIRLADAVSRFEARLPSDEKVAFRNQRARALQSSPDITDVMQFTAHLDSCMSSKAVRCVGPRFTNFLQGVQQFAALGDVIVGGSQNIIACGVWSLVRMSILAVVNFSSYLEKLSFVFMEIGRSVPRHQQMVLLYPQSKNLQAYINEYFIVVVSLCHNMLGFAQKSTMRQLTSALNDATIKTTQTELDMWAREIGAEIRLLVAKRIHVESKESSRFRSIANKLSKSITRQQEIAASLRILDKCSSYDHETAWKQIRKLGNTKLYAQTDEYRAWRMRTESGTLVYLGKLGCGKSVAMANMVDDLNLFVANQNASVAYFFVQHNIPTSSKARTIIGSIARQLLRSRQNLADLLESSDKSPNTEDMLSILGRTAPPGHKSYVVQDGLNLCSGSTGKEVISFVRRLQQQSCVLVCASFRQEPNVETDTTLQTLQSLRLTLVPDNWSDIEDFIDTELAHRLEDGSLVLGDPSLILDMHDALLVGSKGMFLWVALQIASLCTFQTDADIREALAHLPDDLSDIYNRLLQQQGPAQKYQKRIFEFIIAAQRPLTTDELREALGVILGDATRTPAKLINNVYSALATCGCLIVIEEEELTIRFVHPSVQDFLFQCYEGFGNTDMVFEECNETMADVIVTYLSYGVFDTQFDTQISRSRVPQIEAGTAPSRVIESVAACSKNAQNLALKLLHYRKHLDFDIGRILAEHTVDKHTHNNNDFMFVNYARQWCLEHVSAIRSRPLSLHVTNLLPPLLDRNAYNTSSELAPHEAYRMAVEKNNEGLLDLLLQSSSRKFLNSSFHYQWHGEYTETTPMCLAVCKGFKRMITTLAETGEVNPRHNLDQRNVWHHCYAAYAGDVSVFKNLMRGNLKTVNTTTFGSDNHICLSGRSLLACAIWGGHLVMIRYLLEVVRIDPTIGSPDHTPMVEAVMERDIEALDLMRLSNRVFLDADQKEQLVSQARASRLVAAVNLISRWPERPM